MCAFVIEKGTPVTMKSPERTWTNPADRDLRVEGPASVQAWKSKDGFEEVFEFVLNPRLRILVSRIYLQRFDASDPAVNSVGSQLPRNPR